MRYSHRELAIVVASSLVIAGAVHTIVITLEQGKCNDSYVSLTFDDGYRDTFTNALPILQEHDIEATTYVMPGLVDERFENHTLMDWEQLRTLKRQGWEIGSHTYIHANLTRLDREALREQLVLSQRHLQQRGFTAETLAAPYGSYSMRVASIANNHYTAVRPSVWGINDITDINTTHLRSMWVTNTTDWKTIRNGLRSLDPGQWAILGFHNVNKRPGSDRYTVEPAFLENTVEYIAENDIRSKTVHETTSIPC